METKANYVMIGMFAVMTMFVGFIFVLFLVRQELGREYADYDILFNESVSGLTEAGDVRYRGIRIGTVKRMWNDEEDPNTVWVRIEIKKSIPIKEDTSAMLALQGVTGLLYVELSGGSLGAAPIEVEEGREVAVIRSQPSPLAEVFDAAPAMLAKTNLLLLQLSKLTTDENIAAISNSLTNLDRTMSAIGESDEDIRTVLANAASLSEELSEAVSSINAISADIEAVTGAVNTFMNEDAQSMSADLSETIAAINAFAVNANTLVEENRTAIGNFSSQGLGQVGDFVTESRDLVATLNRFARQLEENPSSLLGGKSGYAEYEVAK